MDVEIAGTKESGAVDMGTQEALPGALPRGASDQVPPASRIARRIAFAQRSLCSIYRLEIGLAAERFVIPQQAALDLLPPGSPRTGLAILEEENDLFLGLYFDARDGTNGGTIVEETSHWLCVAWHARQGRRVSRLMLELQGEIDRWIVAHLVGRDPFHHFRRYRWADWIDACTLVRYQTAHELAHRYCLGLARRFPDRADIPHLLAELRRFYRSSSEAKLRRHWF